MNDKTKTETQGKTATATGKSTEAPEGFRPLGEMPNDFAIVSTATLPDMWQHEEDTVLIGVVVQVKTVTIKRGRNAVETRFMIVETENGQVTVWESAALLDLFDVAETNDTVYIKYVGLIDRPNQPQPMKGFECGIKKHPATENASN